ncbi:hypothetical protein EMIT053CA3_270063 [Pseudomonas donghuensis]
MQSFLQVVNFIALAYPFGNPPEQGVHLGRLDSYSGKSTEQSGGGGHQGVVYGQSQPGDKEIGSFH